MKKKALSLVLALSMVSALVAGCGSTSESATEEAATEEATTEEAATEEAAAEEGAETTTDASAIKVGVIYVGDENEGYTAAHMDGIDDMAEALGLSEDQIIEKTTIPEDESCYDAAVDLAEQGCNLIFGTSFGHESYLIQAATEYPDVQFFHATGYQAATSGLSNMHNYFTKIYEARYVSGVVAGLKLNEMIANGDITEDEALVGYVGAYPYAEVVSGYTSFFLGVRSICPSATMEVQYTNSWADMSGENEVATKLIEDGCVLISQHADTTGAPSACEAAGVPCVGYNVDMTTVAPNCALTSAANNWGAYYTLAVENYLNGVENPVDWAEGYADGTVYITPLNDAAIAEGTADKVAEVEAGLADGSIHVFDTSTFTVNGSTLEELIESGDDYAAYADATSDGYYHESELVSAPSFDLRIDGITEK
ncbi:MAG: BMP family ABC transporter substrate-binding protein [Lachnospiraceae bacterium]|nr:BMP family ABC transporter substrate-binding protein [Lachnospiraceae bacterium]